jgi:uncharacterized protein involved in exopolysaccharide biosynthesis
MDQNASYPVSKPLLKLESRTTVRDIIGIFFVKKHVFALTFIGVIVGALLVSFVTPPIYESVAELVVKPLNSKPLLFDQDSSRMNVFSEVTEQTLNTVIFLLTSTDVLHDVVVAQKLAPADNEDKILEVVASLRGRIRAEPLTMSSIVKVSMRGGDPQEVKEQLNSLIDSYIRHHIKVNQRAEGVVQFFEEQTNFFKDQYVRYNQQLAEAGKRLDLIDPQMQKDHNLLFIKDMEVVKADTFAKAESLRAKVAGFKTAQSRLNQQSSSVGLPSETLLNYPSLVEMEKSLAQLTINRQRASSDYQPTSKQVRDAESQISNMRSEIQRYLGQVISDLEGQITSYKRSVDEIDQKINDVRKKSIQISGDALEMDRLTLEHKLNKDNYSLYSTKREEARINEEKDRAQFANVTVASRPTAAISPWFPQRSKIMMLSLPLALMLGLAFSALSYTMEQRLWTPTDVNLHTNLRMLGSLDAIGGLDEPMFTRFRLVRSVGGNST